MQPTADDTKVIGQIFSSLDTKENANIFNMGQNIDYYRIDNYDNMSDFFMTITSGSDIWNFCWAQGGITAGRVNSDQSIFPYYTCDKISDLKNVTGSYACLAIIKDDKTVIWEPFIQDSIHNTNKRILLKSLNGSAVKFIEVNEALQLAYTYEWTSSELYGLIKRTQLINLSGNTVKVKVLEGARNIMSACTSADNQNNNSVLLDAYKKTDLIKDQHLALFGVSSVLSDKAEPSEGLYVNCSYFASNDKVYLGEANVKNFIRSKGDENSLITDEVLKGERASFYILHDYVLDANKQSDVCYQVFDTNYTSKDVAELINFLKNHSDKELASLIENDISETNTRLDGFIKQSDGIQTSAASLTTAHHKANVMFNIMRGGLFADYNEIDIEDFYNQVVRADLDLAHDLKTLLNSETKGKAKRSEIKKLIEDSGNKQLLRHFYEYMPITFSRRHGDPSRPWNRFNIVLKDKEGNNILNYEGNWRDIFQNWEALGWSYPEYVESMYTKFVNAMTIDGFNPYRITKQGIDYETPEKDNPWAQYGYWGDHQVIYLTKLLELQYKINKTTILDKLNNALYSTGNVPYRLKSFEEIKADPHHSIAFDYEQDKKIKAYLSKPNSLDKKLILDNNSPALISLTAKLLQIVASKASSLVPAGGIWMNTQRPEWNDANNALAGWGLSVVTTGYLNRMLDFMLKLYHESTEESYEVPQPLYNLVTTLTKNYSAFEESFMNDGIKANNFLESNQKAFEAQYNYYYANGFGSTVSSLSKDQVIQFLEQIKRITVLTLKANKREDGLYHTYNTLSFNKDSISIEHLQEMLEGQVSIISSNLLSHQEVIDVLHSLKSSKIYESHQNSYMLYPNKELPLFTSKNNVDISSVKDKALIETLSASNILQKDINGVYHFASMLKNQRELKEKLDSLDLNLEESKIQEALELYEKTFNHHSFTGRSGTFYAYEGLGSIYWHMVSKLLLACQEYTLSAYQKDLDCKQTLKDIYYDIRQGLSFNKTPELYGAVPLDPYSHTPYLQGARQPGMTGQVKEEILTRWGEIGIDIKDNKAVFSPYILDHREFENGSDLSFTWCGIDITYKNSGNNPYSNDSDCSITVCKNNSVYTIKGNSLDEDTTKLLLSRDTQSNIHITVEY